MISQQTAIVGAEPEHVFLPDAARPTRPNILTYTTALSPARARRAATAESLFSARVLGISFWKVTKDGRPRLLHLF